MKRLVPQILPYLSTQNLDLFSSPLDKCCEHGLNNDEWQLTPRYLVNKTIAQPFIPSSHPSQFHAPISFNFGLGAKTQ